jgi:chemotaxis response regulator CheB
VLIYFAPTLQTRVLTGFHEGLREGGFLLLGKAEVPMGETKGLFQCVDRKAKLYRIADCGMQIAETFRNPNSEIRNVVVIAASAGGINALVEVLSRLPADLPAAVLIVQHLRDDRPTRLHEHLARLSSLPVRLAEDGLPLEAGVVYLAVPGQHLRVEGSTLVLDRGEPVHYVRPSADVLFASAAQVFGPKVIGVVLSGTGHDGTRGCQEIKGKGGITIAQGEKTSRYFAMPGAAIEADAVDYVLPLGKIAGKIAELVKCEV